MTDTQHRSELEERRAKGGSDHPDTRMDLPDVEKDAAGIPVFVFKDDLSESDKPTEERKTLEVVMLWREAVMSVGHYRDAREITVGDGMKNDFRIACEGLTAERFPLVATENGKFVVNWTDGMALEVRNDKGEILNAGELERRQQVRTSELNVGGGVHQRARQYVVGLHDRIAIQVDQVTFVVQYVSPARIVHTSLLKGLDYYFTKVLGLSFMAHLFLLLALLLTPLDPDNLSDDLFKNPNRFAKLILKEPEKMPEPKKKFELSGAKAGGKHKDDEGKFGKKEAKQKDALASTKGAPKVDPNRREKDRKIALESGIFKALQGGPGGAVSNVFGPGGLGTGVNNALGGLRGANMGDAGGAGGLGSRGSGPGGGGNSLGIGGLGSGDGRGTGGLGNVDLGGRGAGKYQVIPGRTVTKGCLTDQVVMRVIRQAENQARYCYEKELNRNPNLAGQVTTQFTVGPTGQVMSASVAKSTMGSPPVESCLVNVVRRLQFPPCKGGGVADITYPWIFQSGGR